MSIIGSKTRQTRAFNQSVKEGWKLTGWASDFRPIVEKAGRRMAINLDGEHIPQAVIRTYAIESFGSGAGVPRGVTGAAVAG